MIDHALDFLQRQLNTYLRMKLDPADNSDFILLANIARLGEGEQGGGNDNGNNQYKFICAHDFRDRQCGGRRPHRFW